MKAHLPYFDSLNLAAKPEFFKFHYPWNYCHESVLHQIKMRAIFRPEISKETLKKFVIALFDSPKYLVIGGLIQWEEIDQDFVIDGYCLNSNGINKNG